MRPATLSEPWIIVENFHQSAGLVMGMMNLAMRSECFLKTAGLSRVRTSCMKSKRSSKDKFWLTVWNMITGKKDIHEEFVPDLLGGIVRITMTAEEEYGPADDGLYYDCSQVRRRERKLTFIPYYAWANRNEGEMTVWVND